jgi:CheY-like chemotaxis protein
MAREVSVELGPVDAAAALAWVTNARRVVGILRERAAPLPFDVPVHIADQFDHYLAEWEAVAAANDTFSWSGTADSDEVRHLMTYWFNLATVLAERGPELGLSAPPEAEVFYVDLVRALTEALADADEERVGQTLRDSWPGVAEPQETAPADAAGPVRVLLVDDTDDVRLLMRIALETDDRFEVAGEAVNGAEAVDHVSGGCPDAILLDLMMPVMDGMTALPLILERCPQSRVVVHSANATPAVEREALGRGAAGVVAKGAPLERVLAALLP